MSGNYQEPLTPSSSTTDNNSPPSSDTDSSPTPSPAPPLPRPEAPPPVGSQVPAPAGARRCGRRGCAGARSCECPAPLAFPRRVGALPPVRALAGAYANARDSGSVLGCALLAGETGALLASAPAVALARPLHRAFHTPVYVADLLLCKGLDLAERAFPCLTTTPTKVCKAVAFCACGVPAGTCYLATKFACKALRTCLCDIPAVACGLPSLLCCSTAELCLCDAPAALCGIPGKISLKAAHTALGDIESIIRTLESCSDQIVGQCRSDDNGGS